MRNPNAQLAHFSPSFPSSNILGIEMYYCQVLILEYFWIYCILLILLKYLDWDLMSILVWVHISMTNCQNKNLKTSFEPGNSKDILAINTNFLSCSSCVFVILKIIGLVGRALDWKTWVLTKNLKKWYLIPPWLTLSTQVRIKGKVE